MTTEVNVYPTADNSGQTVAVIETRTGSALPLKEPQVIKLTGNIESVSAFLTSRKKVLEGTNVVNAHGLQLIDSKKAIVVVDEIDGTIILMLDPENSYGASITGKLSEAVELDLFKINTDETYSREQLIKVLRFNRAYFPDKDEHAALLAAFMKFSVKVYCDLEKENDQRGNAQAMFKQTVNSNVPLNFQLKMPIYKGQPEEKFNVEIGIDANGSNVRFYFESVELSELIETRKREIFSKELTHCSDFPIIKK